MIHKATITTPSRIPLWFIGDTPEEAIMGMCFDDGGDAHRWAHEDGRPNKVWSFWAYVDPESASSEENI